MKQFYVNFKKQVKINMKIGNKWESAREREGGKEKRWFTVIIRRTLQGHVRGRYRKTHSNTITVRPWTRMTSSRTKRGSIKRIVKWIAKQQRKGHWALKNVHDFRIALRYKYEVRSIRARLSVNIKWSMFESRIKWEVAIGVKWCGGGRVGSVRIGKRQLAGHVAW